MIKLDKKNKIMLLLTICMFTFLAWQVYELLMPSSSTSHTVETKRTMRSEIKKTLIKTKPKKSSMLPKAQVAALSTSQKRYVSLVEKIEYYKMQHQLLVQQLAVAKARAQIAQLKLASHHFSGDLTIAASPQAQGRHISLSYLGKEGKKWVATVNISGHYKTVHIGDQIQNGLSIRSISDQGVVLSNNKLTKRLTFSGEKIISTISTPDKTVLTKGGLPVTQHADSARS